MNEQTTPNITLFDLLARCWQRPAGVRHIRFNDEETELAVVTEDGAVAFARMADNEPPESRIVADNGQTGIHPRAGRPSPLIMTRIKGASAACPAGAGGFLVGNEKGQLIRLSRAGEIADTVFSGDTAVTAFDRCGASGALAIVAGDRLFCRTGAASALTDGMHCWKDSRARSGPWDSAVPVRSSRPGPIGSRAGRLLPRRWRMRQPGR